MPAVFVHGVPDTVHVWQPTIDLLKRKDIVTLALPGFGVPLPPGFTPDKDSYVNWLIDALRGIEGPIDLVGHDWGSLLVVRTMCLEPDIARSWIGGSAPVDPDYVWHQAAQIWQTPEAGEAMMAQLPPEAMAATLVAQGQPPEVAAHVIPAWDETMKSSILSLYRSATNAGTEWFADLAKIAAPGLLIWGEGDPYVPVEFGEKLARNTRARLTVIKDCGHWWEAQKPKEAAALMEAFWRGLR